jgi:hypothetical protein
MFTLPRTNDDSVKGTEANINCRLPKREDRLCGVVVRVPGYRPRGPVSIPGATKFFRDLLGLERGPLSLVSTTEELLDRKVAAPV